MKNKLENDNKKGNLNILKTLKRILFDADNGVEEIPELEKIYKDPATSEEEKDLIAELMKSQSKMNRFKDILKVKPYKLRESASKSEDKKIDKKIEKERID